MTLLAGCGFHLAGTRPLPPQLSSVYIDVVTPYRVSKPPLESALGTRLLRRGAHLHDSLGAARTLLRVSELRESREVLSVDPFGKAVEYTLTTRVKYELIEGGNVLVAPDTLQVSRDYSFNAQQVLAKEAEELRLQTFMQDELAELLLLRLEALLAKPAAAPPAAPEGEPPGR
ncbi:MAG: LPS-assembly lipoprotein LptE [Gammaproteobacteria bacterium]